MPAFSTTCCNLVDRLKELVSPHGSYELDIAAEFQKFSADVISRTAFGSSYEEGKKIFELQKEQAVLVLEAHQEIYIPGLRCSTPLMTLRNSSFLKYHSSKV